MSPLHSIVWWRKVHRTVVVPEGFEQLKICCKWKDQGWGTRKGRLFVAVKRGTKKLCEHDLFGLAPHTWVTKSRIFLPSELSNPCPGDAISIEYVAGGKGIHRLHVQDLKISFQASAPYRLLQDSIDHLLLQADEQKDDVLAKQLDRLEEKADELGLHGRYHRGRGLLEKDYVLTRKVLGTGITGDVRLARSRHSQDRRFAVKTYDINALMKHKNGIASLVSEIEIMLSVDHPHIIRLLDIYQTPSKVYLVMECADGGELFDRIWDKIGQGSHFSEDEAADTTRQMLSVMCYLHGQGIVHRDLKPENFLFETKGGDHLKLIDFGFSCRWDGVTPMSEKCGTAAYAAPEVWSLRSTSKTDIWSVGVITYTLLCGRLPFETIDVKYGRCGWGPKHWRGVGDDAKDLIQRLVCADTDRRLTASAALQHQWITARTKLPILPNLHLEFLQGLQRFQGASRLQQVALLTMTRSMTQIDIDEQARNYFMHFDTSHSGVIEVRQLAQIAGAVPDDNGEIEQLLEGLNTEGLMTYSQFLAAMVPNVIKSQEYLRLDASKRFDLGSVEEQDALQLFLTTGAQTEALNVNGTRSLRARLLDSNEVDSEASTVASSSESLPLTPTDLQCRSVLDCIGAHAQDCTAIACIHQAHIQVLADPNPKSTTATVSFLALPPAQIDIEYCSTDAVRLLSQQAEALELMSQRALATTRVAKVHSNITGDWLRGMVASIGNMVTSIVKSGKGPSTQVVCFILIFIIRKWWMGKWMRIIDTVHPQVKRSRHPWPIIPAFVTASIVG